MSNKSYINKAVISCIILFVIGVLAEPSINTSALTYHAPNPSLDRFVSNSGSDISDCANYLTPCATINYAIQQALPGNTIALASGVYTGDDGSVVYINKDINIIGGWDEYYDIQSGFSKVDGEKLRKGIYIASNPNKYNVHLDHLVIENGYNPAGGAGIYNAGNLSVTRSIIRNNNGTGIENWNGDLALENSSIHSNSGTGVHSYTNSPSIVISINITNSTISNNRYGISTDNNTSTTVNSSTISDNKGGGMFGQTILIRNTILANNKYAYGDKDCEGTITSGGYNILGTTNFCTFISSVGDHVNVNPGLGTFLPTNGYHPIYENSLAVDNADSASCPPVDQRGVERLNCDIGAYEYTTPGSPFYLYILNGDNQHIAPNKEFHAPLTLVVLDALGSPVPGTLVTFQSPMAGPGVIFNDTGGSSTSAVSDLGGIVSSSRFTSKEPLGQFQISATSSAGVLFYSMETERWYVSINGDDNNDCKSPATPCATLKGVVVKPHYDNPAEIWVTSDIYDLGYDPLYLTHGMDIYGGWDSTFTEQVGYTQILGQIDVHALASVDDYSVLIERFIISPSNAATLYPIGIKVFDNALTVRDSIITNNSIGIENRGGILTILNSSIINNQNDSGFGRGVDISGSGITTIINSTISGNGGMETSQGGGVLRSGGSLVIINSSIVGNIAGQGGGVYGSITVINTIIIGNQAYRDPTYGPDCYGTLTSGGHNLIGTLGVKTLWGNYPCYLPNPQNTDQFGADAEPIPALSVLETSLTQDDQTGQWYHPLIPSGLAINAGNPFPPATNSESCPLYDQLGILRPQGAACDIGAVEYVFSTSGPPSAFSKHLPTSGTIKVPTNPLLSWQGSVGVDYYEYCYDSTNDNLCSNWISTGKSVGVALSNLAPNTTYYWHVRAINNEGVTYANGSDKSYWSFTTVPLPGAFKKQTPNNAATKLPVETVISWSSSLNAVRYEYCISQTINVCSDWKNAEYTSDIPTGLVNNTTYYWQVRAINSAGIVYADAGAWWSFTVAIAPPVSVLPGSVYPGPADNIHTRRPTFLWNPVTSASGYILEVTLKTDWCNFSSAIISTSITTTSYVPTSDLAANTGYCWRVKATGLNGPSAFSQVRVFTTGNPPSTPVLIAPTDKALITSPQPLFDWSNSTVPSGEVFNKYQIQIATDPEFKSNIIDHDTLLGNIDDSAYIPLSPLIKGVTYYWRVRSWNTDQDYSAWAMRSVRIAYAPPNTISPGNPYPAGPADNTHTRRPTFTWDPVPGATGYALEVAASRYCTSFSTKAINVTVTTNVYTATKDLAAGTVYCWRVRATGANGPSLYSQVRTFTTGNPPTVPGLSAPANNILLTSTAQPTFEWANSTSATPFSHYEFQIDTSNTFATASTFTTAPGDINDSDLTPPTAGFPVLNRAITYYWRVRAWNSAGDFSGWSPTFSFRIAYEAPLLLSPTDGLTLLTLKPTFTWQAVLGATSYKIQVSTSPTFGTTVVNVTVNTTTYTRTTNLTAKKTHYWRVQAMGTYGPSAWSAVWSFVTP